MKKNRPAIFIDRDGTLIRERGYLSDPASLKFYSGVVPGLARVSKKGWPIVILTNQSGVGRGYFSLAVLHRVHRELKKRLASGGARLSGIYFCPHRPDGGCRCRKPAPGMAKRAARELRLDLKRSFVIGDQERDIQLARNIGASGILVLTGAGRQTRRRINTSKFRVAASLAAALRWIERSASPRSGGRRRRSV